VGGAAVQPRAPARQVKATEARIVDVVALVRMCRGWTAAGSLTSGRTASAVDGGLGSEQRLTGGFGDSCRTSTTYGRSKMNGEAAAAASTRRHGEHPAGTDKRSGAAHSYRGEDDGVRTVRRCRGAGFNARHARGREGTAQASQSGTRRLSR
jgi:hypothetical protein